MAVLQSPLVLEGCKFQTHFAQAPCDASGMPYNMCTGDVKKRRGTTRTGRQPIVAPNTTAAVLLVFPGADAAPEVLQLSPNP